MTDKRDDKQPSAESLSRPSLPDKPTGEVTGEAPAVGPDLDASVSRITSTPADGGTDPAPSEPEPEEHHWHSNLEYIEEHAKHEAIAWVKETSRGVVLAVITTVVSLVLVRIGAAIAGKEFAPNFLKPLELWNSFSGLVIEWSQLNEWLLLALGCGGLVATALRYLWWRRQRTRRRPAIQGGQSIILERLEKRVQSFASVSAFAMWTAVLLASFGYQEYLWHVKLPVPNGKIGVAFSHAAGVVVPREQLADLLREAGHEGQIDMVDLPVKFDARDTAKAQQLARRIHAEAVVIYQEEKSAGSAPPGAPGQKSTGTTKLLAATAATSGTTTRQVVYLVFADPSIGVQIPVPRSPATPGGAPQQDALQRKEGVEVPRLEAADVGRLMEAAAGILLYNKDRYLPAIAHLTNALPAGSAQAPSACSTPTADSGSATAGQADPATGLIRFYLGNTYSLLNQPDPAGAAFDGAIAAYAGEARDGTLTVQDRLVLAKAFNARAELAFDVRSLDCTEALLKQAVALRAPLDGDESALKDPATQRSLHSTFGETYFALAQLAEYRQQPDEAQYWSDAAQKEAQALLGLTADPRAQRTGIWLLYTAGSCDSAYAAAQTMIARNPNDINAHRLLAELAGRRDILLSLEQRQQMNDVLRIDPTSVPDLLHLLNLIAVQAYFQDSNYLQDAHKTEQAVLQADPNNVSALREYIDLVVTLGGNGMYGDVPADLNTQNIPAVRTAAAVTDVSRWDTPRILQTLKTLDDARPEITRWAEQVAPASVEPLLYRARLSKLEAQILHYYQVLRSPQTRDPAVGVLYDKAWNLAKTQAEAVLGDPLRHATAREQEQAHALIVDLLLQRATAKLADGDKPAAQDAVNQAIVHAKAALALVDANPPHTRTEENADADVLQSIGPNVALAGSVLGNLNDDATAQGVVAQFGAIADRWQQAVKQYVQQTTTENDFRQQHTCTGGDLLQQASKAEAAGDHAKALDLAQQYNRLYSGDPGGILTLGWYQYRSGGTAAALTTNVAFEKALPAHPFGPGNQTVFLLAQGHAAEAQQSAAQMLKLLADEPLGRHLSDLAATGGDLSELAREQPAARDGVRALLPALDQHLNTLPPEARAAKGVEYVDAITNLSSAAFWAGDYQAAERWTALGLAVDENNVLLRLNHAVNQLALGSPPAAQQELSRGIAAADGYLLDSSGNPLSGAQRDTAAAAAKQQIDSEAAALDTWLKQRTDLQNAGQPLLDALQQASAKYAH